MLSKINNEVLSHGPEAVLPQNLNKKWLNILQEMAEDFIGSNHAYPISTGLSGSAGLDFACAFS
jgi:hypothetical protein